MNKCDACGKDCVDCQHCALCGGQNYCSAKCKADAWTEHQDECNVHDVPAGATIAHDYAYEDFCDERELKGVEQKNLFFNQKHRLRTVQPNGKIETREIGAKWFGDIPSASHEAMRVGTVGVGEDPSKWNIGDVFDITVEERTFDTTTNTFVQQQVFKTEKRDIKEFAISKASTNEQVQRLVKSRTLKERMQDKAVFWSGELRPTSGVSPDISASGGMLVVYVNTYDTSGNDVRQASVSFLYGELKTLGLDKVRKRARGVLGKFSQQLRIKGLGTSTSAAIHAKGFGSVEVRLIYDTTGQRERTVTIKDIEVVVPKKAFYVIPQEESENPLTEISATVTQFSVDPRQIEHVTGLVAAFDEHISEIQEAIHALPASHPERAELIAKDRVLNATLTVLQEHHDALEEHLRAKKKARTFDVSGKVNAAIHEATQELWKAKHIGVRWKAARDPVFKMTLERDLKKKESARGRLATLRTYYAQLLSEALGRGQKGTSFKSWIMGKKGKVLGRVRAFQDVLDAQIDMEADNKSIEGELDTLKTRGNLLFDSVKRGDEETLKSLDELLRRESGL